MRGAEALLAAVEAALGGAYRWAGAALGISRPKAGREGLASGEVTGRGGRPRAAEVPRVREAASVRRVCFLAGCGGCPGALTETVRCLFGRGEMVSFWLLVGLLGSGDIS